MLNVKTLKYLIALSCICMVGLVFIVFRSDDPTIFGHNKLLLPQLQPQHVSKLIVRDHDNMYTFYKEGSIWKILEKHGYPVVHDRVEEILYSLADLRIIEPKTTNPEYFQALGVNEVETDGADGIAIQAEDAQGSKIAQLILGKREEARIFVRKPNDQQTWLVQGFVDLSNELRDWVEQPLLGLNDEDQIKSVSIANPNGKHVLIAKQTVDDQDFVLSDAKTKGKEILDLDSINSLPYTLAEIEYLDVQPSSDLNWSNAIKVTINTFNDKQLQMDVMYHEGQVIARVDTRPGWYYKIASQAYALLSVENSDFVIPDLT